jgi:tetratricopeptide (TPR) repeat protein
MSKQRSNIHSTDKLETAPEPLSRVSWGIAVAILILTVVVFLPVRGFEFVNYDDGDYVMGNREVQHGLNWESIRWAFRTGHAANWHPVTWISHILDFQMFGNVSGSHHLTSLFFHATNAVLLFFLLRNLTRSIWKSAFVAAIFALHPVHVESVAWVSERKDVLSGFFWMLTVLFYEAYARKQTSDRNRYLFYGLSLVVFILGLMSKPMLVTLPFVLVLLDFWPLQRVRSGEKLSGLLLEKVPYFLLAGLSSYVTFAVQKEGGAVATIQNLSFPGRLSNAFVSYFRYVQKMLWPDNLAVLYPHPGSWPLGWIILGVTFVIALVAIAIWQARRRPYILVGSFWFLGTLIPVIGIVQVGIQSMADRYTYLPSIGFWIAATWLFAEIGGRAVLGRRIVAFVGIGCVLICIPLTIRQLGFWHDSEALFRRTVSVTDKNYLAWNNLGFSLPKSRAEEAIKCYENSITINPNYADALNNLGHAYAEQGKVMEALPLYERALQQQPKSADINNNYGNALAEMGKVDQAIAHYLIALATNTNHADAHNNFGIALAMRGQFDEAVFHLQRGIQLDPGKASAYSNLGNAFAVQHKLNEATLQYRRALSLKPDDAQVHNNLGNVLSEQTNFEEAINEYQLALKLNPKNPEAHYNIGLALVRVNRNSDAIQHLQSALLLRPNYPDAQRQLTALTATR